MKAKKFISTILCMLTISASTIIPVSAAKSADPNNSQIVNKVNLFNSSRLEKLDHYIYRTDIESYRTGIDSIIARDLVDLYKRLDNLVVSDITIANELLAPANIYDPISIGSQLEDLFSCLFTIDYNSSHDNLNDSTNLIFSNAHPIFTEKKHSQLSEVRVESTEMRAKLIIESLNDRLDQIDFFNSKNKK